VSLIMFATCVAPSFSWLIRRVFMKLGKAITEMMRITAITTMSSTKLTPLVGLRLGNLFLVVFFIVDRLFPRQTLKAHWLISRLEERQAKSQILYSSKLFVNGHLL